MSPSVDSPLLEAVAPLLPGAAEGATASDDAGRLPPELVAQLAATGVFRATVPAEHGGLEVPLRSLAEVIEAVATAHGSAGWCVMIGSTTALLSGWLDPVGAAEVWGHDPLVVTGGAYAPTGRAVDRGDGSFEVDGRWEWGSGSEHCSWLLGGAMVVDGTGEHVRDGAGLPVMRLCFAPAAEVRIVENWDVFGMRGTGSHDLEMHGALVPAHRTVSLVTDRPRASGPLYRFPPFGLLALGIAAVSLGVARSAVDAFVDLAVAKTPAMSARSLGRRSTVRAELARCTAELRAARSLYFEEVDGAWAHACGGEEFSVQQRAALRLAATHAATAAADVCGRLHRLGGGTSVRHGQVLERTMRDSHTATQHILVGPPTFETVGGVLLGDQPGLLEL